MDGAPSEATGYDHEFKEYVDISCYPDYAPIMVSRIDDLRAQLSREKLTDFIDRKIQEVLTWDECKVKSCRDSLIGGNIQKVVLSKELETLRDCDIPHNTIVLEK